MARKAHPADQEHARAMAKAIGFIASLHVGMGRYEKSPVTETLAGARAWGRRLCQQHRTFARALIYILLPNERQVHVPDSYQPEREGNVSENENQEQQPAAPQPAAADAQPAPAGEQAKENETMTATQTAETAKTRKAKGAAKKAKTAKAPKAKREPKPKKLGMRAQIQADAEAGKLPSPPDFSAETHARFRDKLKELVKLAKDGDIKGLKAYKINPVSTSPKAMDRYRNLCVTALEAQKKH